MPPLQLSPHQPHKSLRSRTRPSPPSSPESMLITKKMTIGGVLKHPHQRRYHSSHDSHSHNNSSSCSGSQSTTPPQSPSSSSRLMMRRPPKPSSSSSTPNSPRRTIDYCHDEYKSDDDKDNSSSSRLGRPDSRTPPRPRALSWSPTTPDNSNNNNNSQRSPVPHSSRPPPPPPPEDDDPLAVAQRALRGAMRRYGSVTTMDGSSGSRPGSLWDARVAPHLLHVGNLHFRRGQYDAARDCYQRALFQCQPGSHVGDTCANLGTVLWTTGHVDPALQLLHRALDAYQRCDTEEEGGDADASSESSAGSSSSRTTASAAPSSSRVERVANVYHQLGLAHCLKGDCETALQCLYQALQLRESSLSSSSSHSPSSNSSTTPSPALAQTRDALAKVLTCQSRWEAAAAQHELALGHWQAAIQSGAVPPTRALPTMRNLADLLCRLSGGSLSTSSEPAIVPPSSAGDDDVRGAWIALAHCYERLGRGKAAQACRRESANVP